MHVILLPYEYLYYFGKATKHIVHYRAMHVYTTVQHVTTINIKMKVNSLIICYTTYLLR